MVKYWTMWLFVPSVRLNFKEGREIKPDLRMPRILKLFIRLRHVCTRLYESNRSIYRSIYGARKPCSVPRTFILISEACFQRRTTKTEKKSRGEKKKKKSNWQLARGGKKRRWDKRNVRSAPPRLNQTQSLCTSEMTRTETAYFLKILFSVNNFFPRVKIFPHLIRDRRRFKSPIKNDNAPWNENVYVLRWNEISIS